MKRVTRKTGVTITTEFTQSRVMYTLSGELTRVDKELDAILKRYPAERYFTYFTTDGFNVDGETVTVNKRGERFIVASEE